MNVEYRMLKVCMLSILIKRMSKAKPSFVILRFDIRYSAVRCLIQAIVVGILIIKKPCHFSVVSYERRLWPRASSLIKKETLPMVKV